MPEHSRPTLGVWGPGPDDKSGVAAYITTSLTHLAHRFRPQRLAGPSAGADRFDQVLYHLGNNELHHGAFRALAERPGPILLHEYNNLNYYYESWGALPAAEQAAVLSTLGTALGTTFSTRGALERYFREHPEVDRFSVDAGIERLAIEAATVVLVHSPHVAAYLGDRYPAADIRHLPFPVSPLIPNGPSVRTRYGIPAGAYLYGTFGFLGAYKRIPTVLAAWQCWADRPADAMLLLAGEARDGLVVPDDPSIVHTGYLPTADFRSLLLAADCGIQLRGPWLGESSGPASALIAHHRPVILSDIPGMHPHPADDGQLLVPTGPDETSALISAMRSQYQRPRTAPHFDPRFSWTSWTEEITAALTARAPQ
ncbi:hypothetical protein [Kitasatospora sp. GAS1066B]|uniref:hypothetical protein n=1 Tax=Kitasatospora sp. GAS1066B TaxID=3156271 RepID=UPI0035177E9C